jgi:hypothetical protein
MKGIAKEMNGEGFVMRRRISEGGREAEELLAESFRTI